MRSMLEHVAKQLVDDPNAVVVTEELDGVTPRVVVADGLDELPGTRGA